MIADRLSQTILRWLFETSLEKGPLRKVDLRLLSRESQTDSDQTLIDWQMGSTDPSATNVPNLIAEIMEVAQEDVRVLGDTRCFFICGYFGKDPKYAARSFVFPIHPSERRKVDGFLPCVSNETRVTADTDRYCS